MSRKASGPSLTHLLTNLWRNLSAAQSHCVCSTERCCCWGSRCLFPHTGPQGPEDHLEDLQLQTKGLQSHFCQNQRTSWASSGSPSGLEPLRSECLGTVWGSVLLGWDWMSLRRWAWGWTAVRAVATAAGCNRTRTAGCSCACCRTARRNSPVLCPQPPGGACAASGRQTGRRGGGNPVGCPTGPLSSRAERAEEAEESGKMARRAAGVTASRLGLQDGKPKININHHYFVLVCSSSECNLYFPLFGREC